MAQNKLKSSFLQDGEVKNNNLATASVDSRVIKPASVSNSHIVSGTITVDKLDSKLGSLILPNKDVYYALANSYSPSSDNPFATRKEIFTYKTVWKEPVKTYQDLPGVNSGFNQENDIRLVANEKQLYLWSNKEWIKFPIESSSANTNTEQTSLQDVRLFSYTFDLGVGASYDLEHDHDPSINRILQLKEKIEGTTPIDRVFDFDDSEEYNNTSVYTLHNATLNSSSMQVVGNTDTPWDQGIVGLICQDEENNGYRVISIIKQGNSNLPSIINLNSKLKYTYSGNFYISNAVVSNNEISIVRQDDATSFDLLKDTSLITSNIKKTQVLSSKLTGISAVLSIREDNELIFTYKSEGSTEWDEYAIEHTFNGVQFPIEVENFYACHIATSPLSETLNSGATDVMTQTSNLTKNDIYAIAYVEKGTKIPCFLSWCHNFGDPNFYERKILDDGIQCVDIHMNIKEIKTDTHPVLTEPTQDYVVGITASVLTGDETDKIAVWLNNGAGPILQSYWNINCTGKTVQYTYGDNPKILLTPQYSPEDLIIGTAPYDTEWYSENYSIWVFYQDKQDKNIKCFIVKAFDDTLVVDKTSVYIYQSVYPGEMINFSTNMYYNTFTVFDTISITNKYNYDVALWENYTEPGLLYRNDSTPHIHIRGTAVVAAVNELENSAGHKTEILVAYRDAEWNAAAPTWSYQNTGKYGQTIKILSEKQYTKYVDNTGVIFEKNKSNRDNIHIFYINKEVNSLAVPVHIHNRFGCWKTDSDLVSTYNNRIRNFSDPLQYLGYSDLTTFDFDLNEFGEVEFAAFCNSQNTDTRGLYYALNNYKCKFAIWDSRLGTQETTLAPRAGFIYFYNNGYFYIQGGYDANGQIDTSMWRLNVLTNTWEKMVVNNAPERVFHSVDIVENVAYRGIVAPNIFDTTTDAFTTVDHANMYVAGDGKQYTWLDLSNFKARSSLVNTGTSSSGSNSYQSFFEYNDSPTYNLNVQYRNPIYGDVESITLKVATTEGYRDSILNYEIYNLTTGAHGVIEDISEPMDPSTGQRGIGSGTQVCLKIKDVKGGSRNTFIASDQISISYPGRPKFDQVVIYGGGAYDPSRSNGYPDDQNASITWPIDYVSISNGTNLGDNEAYKNARTTFVADLDERKGNRINFVWAPTATGGAANAPVPCITGALVATGYTRNSDGLIAGYPNFVLLNRTNAYRFTMNYEQNIQETGRPFSFLGTWSQLDAEKSIQGEPLEGLTAWRGAKLYHYGGIKPAPDGHADNPYMISPSIVYFGGYTLNDSSGYYSNSLSIINMSDVKLGWSTVIPLSEDAPSARCGNGIMVTNKQIELRSDTIDTIDYIKFNKICDIDSDVWVFGGNNSPLDIVTANNSSSKNDLWYGKIKYERKTYSQSGVYEFAALKDEPDMAEVNIRISGLNSMVVPNGIRTSDNTKNSFGYQLFSSDGSLNDRYTQLSINDINMTDRSTKDISNTIYEIYKGTDLTPNYPDWIDSVSTGTFVGTGQDETSGDITQGRIIRNGYYYPDSGSPDGERRWTFLARLTMVIPAGPGSGSYDFYAGVFNNGINSYVEFFIPTNAYFAFNLAFIELSGGWYNTDTTINSGKSWFDCGTGTFHLQIKNILNQKFIDNYYPYISEINDIQVVEITGVEWFDMTSEIAKGPLANTWGGFISNSFDPTSIIYFGGRAYQKSLLNNILTWNSPSVFIQNEQSDEYTVSDVDGSDSDHFITLKHDKIVPDAAIAKIGDNIDYPLTVGNPYSGWGVIKLIAGDSLSYIQKSVSYIGFYIIPNIIDEYGQINQSGESGTNWESQLISTYHTGCGKLVFETIDTIYGVGSGFADPIFEGEINYQTGKIWIKPTTLYGYDLSDSKIQIVDINYHTYDGSQKPYYYIDTLNNDTIMRVEGDKVGGEYSSRIMGSIYTTESAIDSTQISSFRDDRARTIEFNLTSLIKNNPTFNYWGYWEITDGDISDNDTFTCSQHDWQVILDGAFGAGYSGYPNPVVMLLYIPGEGYYQIKNTGYSSTSFDIEITGPLGDFLDINDSYVNRHIVPRHIDSAYVLPYYVSTEMFESDLYMPELSSDLITVPSWLIHEMKVQMEAAGGSIFNPTLNTIINQIENNNNQAKVFMQLVLSSNIYSNVKAYQYYLVNPSGTPYLVPRNELILSENGVLSLYDSTTYNFDSPGTNPYRILSAVQSVTYNPRTSLESDWEFRFGWNSLTSGNESGSIADVSLEVNILYDNESKMTLPITINNPESYLEWQDTSIGILFSFDNNITWKKYRPEADLWIAVDPDNIMDEGMTLEDLENIVSFPWSGWNNAARSQERHIAETNMAFIEGITEQINVIVGVKTNEPANTPSVNSIIMNFYSGSYWEPKNFFQEGDVFGTNSAYLQAQLISSTITRIINKHSTDNKTKHLKASILLDKKG